MTKAFELVIFDCDGVLVDSELLSTRAYETVFARAGMPLAAGALARCFGLKQDVILKRFEAEMGQHLPDSAIAELWPETKKLFEAELETTPDLIAFLQKLPFKKAVASSSHPERLAVSLKKTGLDGFFGKNVYSTTLVKNGKPAPDIFLLVADQFKIKPQNAVVIEDSPFGIEGAKAAGMTAIGYLGGLHIEPGHDQKLRHAGADFIADHWHDIDIFLKQVA